MRARSGGITAGSSPPDSIASALAALAPSCGAGVPAVDEDVALRPGEQQRRDVVGADVVEVAGNAERFGVELPSAPFRAEM